MLGDVFRSERDEIRLGLKRCRTHSWRLYSEWKILWIWSCLWWWRHSYMHWRLQDHFWSRHRWAETWRAFRLLSKRPNKEMQYRIRKNWQYSGTCRSWLSMCHDWPNKWVLLKRYWYKMVQRFCWIDESCLQTIKLPFTRPWWPERLKRCLWIRWFYSRLGISC